MESSPLSATGPVPTYIEVIYPLARGQIGLRGSAPLSWEETTRPTAVRGDAHLFRLMVDVDEPVELKVVRRDEAWAEGRNFSVHAGDHLRLEPYFDSAAPKLEEGQRFDHAGRSYLYDVLLPPSYAEQPNKRYPVAYVLDGQSLWVHSQDPFGVWQLDQTLTSLFELNAIADIIVVALHTAEARLETLSPVPDPQFGGGAGDAFLAMLVDGLLPAINARYRTLATRESTAILGSSMGGLFAFYAAWTRSDVFGKAGCLSSSFWWASRWAVRLVQKGPAPSPRPLFYLDTGAAPNRMDQDASVRDGFHHTRSMHRALTRAGFEMGTDLHRLVFPGHVHNAGAWASRVALPLQLLFPLVPPPFDADAWNDIDEAAKP